MRTLTSLLGNSQKLDGGAMFGNAPKALWSRWYQPDELNRIDLACRCLLIREGDRIVLLETGIGAFFSPALRDRFGVTDSEHALLAALADHGLEPTDIDVIVLSHLHFDHAGGLLTSWSDETEHRLAFPNASLVVSAEALARARSPHSRDRASFIPALLPLMDASGRLEVVQGERSRVLGEGYAFHYSDGHTPGLMMTEIDMPAGPIVFAADLIPGTAWVHVPITMGYDRFPELLIEEKRELLEDLVAREGRLFYTHDSKVALSRIACDQRGRFRSTDPRAAITELDD